MALFRNFGGYQLFSSCLKQSFDLMTVRYARRPNFPKKRNPIWLPKQHRVLCDEAITTENKEFIQEIIGDQLNSSKFRIPTINSPLKGEPITPVIEWRKGLKRTGLIAKKIGVYPMWLKNGKKVSSTLLQVIDNEVVKYIPPEQYKPVVHGKNKIVKNKIGCLVVGSDDADPQLFTKEYASLFTDTGVMPKRILMRFHVSPEAALQPGTPLHVTHFKPGEFIDVRGKTVDRGFQGVMKRWGFKGMPASHGQTKTHRKPGCIGSGRKHRVMPGTKMPGHMGNHWRVLRGVRILRINTKYNVIWVLGQNIPGETNTFCYLYDTLLPLRQPTIPPHFPTYLPDIKQESLPEDLYAEDVHSFSDPTITFTEN